MFPASQLKILPYNRVVKDLNGMSADGFLKRLADEFRLDSNGQKVPDGPESVCIYLEGQWHTLKWDAPQASNPIDRLDVSFLQDHILTPHARDRRSRVDNRIDFIGGIRGTAELEKRVDGGEWAVAFSMYPTTVQQLIDIADAGEIMPPKSTWFEPKLRSGSSSTRWTEGASGVSSVLRTLRIERVAQASPRKLRQKSVSPKTTAG